MDWGSTQLHSTLPWRGKGSKGQRDRWNSEIVSTHESHGKRTTQNSSFLFFYINFSCWWFKHLFLQIILFFISFLFTLHIHFLSRSCVFLFVCTLFNPVFLKRRTYYFYVTVYLFLVTAGYCLVIWVHTYGYYHYYGLATLTTTLFQGQTPLINRCTGSSNFHSILRSPLERRIAKAQV